MSREKYLNRKYGITERIYQQMLEDQGGVCKVCGRNKTEKGKPILFHIDHCHAIPKIKLKAECNPYGGWGQDHKRWHVETKSPPAKYPRLYAEAYGDTRAEAVLAVRRILLAKSVRGAICWGCNSLLAKGRDKPEIFQAAANYLREFEARYR